MRKVGEIMEGLNWSCLKCQRMRRFGNRKCIPNRRNSMNKGRKVRRHGLSEKYKKLGSVEPEV